MKVSRHFDDSLGTPPYRRICEAGPYGIGRWSFGTPGAGRLIRTPCRSEKGGRRLRPWTGSGR